MEKREGGERIVWKLHRAVLLYEKLNRATQKAALYRVTGIISAETCAFA